MHTTRLCKVRRASPMRLPRALGVEPLEQRLFLAVDVWEPNDAFDQAVDLGRGDQFHQSLTIHAAGNEDWYRWTPFESGTVAVQAFFRHAGGDLDLALYDARESLLVSSTSTTDDELVSFSVAYGQDYYIRVYGFAGATHDDYDLYVDGQPSTQIYPDALERNDTVATAADLGRGDQFLRSLTLDYDQIEQASRPHDWYRWTASADGELVVDVSLRHALGDVDVQVYDADQTLLAASQTTSDHERVTIAAVDGSSYLIHVYGYQNVASPGYDLHIDGPEIAADLWEPNDSFAAATDLGSANQIWSGLTVHTPADQDWFRFESPGLGTVEVRLFFPHAEGDLDLFVFDAEQTLIASSTSTANQEQAAVLASPGEAFYIQVAGYGGATHPGYELQVAAFPDYVLDPTLPPIVETLPGLAGGEPRRVAAVRAPDGTVGSFVLDEVILYAPEPSILANFTATYGAEVLLGPDLPAAPPSVPADEVREEVDGGDYYLLRVDLEQADALGLSTWMAELGFEGGLTFSTDEALALSAILAKERVVSGLTITPNVVYSLASPDVVLSGTEEYSVGGGNFYNGFEFDWVHDAEIQVSRAWQYYDLLNLNRTASLAIVDQGFALNGDFPPAASVPQYDFVHDDYDARGDRDNGGGWHGTGALSTAAAQPDDQFGAVGVGGFVAAPMLFQKEASHFSTAQAIRTAVKWGADVINVSWGGECGWWCRNFGIFSGMDSLTSAVAKARDHDVIVVASAGNDGADLDSQTYIPCEIDHVIGVGALNLASKRAVRSGETWSEPGTLWWSSNYGSKVDIWAPGDRIHATPDPDSFGAMTTFNGTSAASPFVAGVLAILKAIKPDLTVDQALGVLQSTANASADPRVATGYVDAYEAVKAVAVLAGVQPQGDLFEPNDVTPRTIASNVPSFVKTIAPNDVDRFSLAIPDYMQIQATVNYGDDVTPGNQLVATLQGVAGNDAGGVITLSDPFVKPTAAALEVAGAQLRSINSYTVQWSAVPAIIAPDAFDDQSPAGELRNDSLTHAAVVDDIVQANLLMPMVSLQNLNHDVIGDVDFFTIQLDAATDPLTGAPECFQPGDPEYGAAGASQGYFEISVHPQWLDQGIQRQFEIVVYQNGQPLNSPRATQSALSYRLDCPHQDFPDGVVTFSVRDTIGRNFYEVALQYRRADVRFYPPPDWFLLADPPLFGWPGPWPPIDVPQPGEIPLVYPRDPLVVDRVLGGELVDPLPPEYVLFDWREQGDYLAEIVLPGGGELRVRLVNDQGTVVAEAEPVSDPETRNASRTLRLMAPRLPAGGYALELSGGPFGIPYQLTAGPTPLLDADFNDDGAVTGIDLLMFQRGFGRTDDAANRDGDADGDGRVSGADFLAWEDSFGEPIELAPESGASAMFATLAAEPDGEFSAGLAPESIADLAGCARQAAARERSPAVRPIVAQPPASGEASSRELPGARERAEMRATTEGVSMAFRGKGVSGGVRFGAQMRAAERQSDCGVAREARMQHASRLAALDAVFGRQFR